MCQKKQKEKKYSQITKSKIKYKQKLKTASLKESNFDIDLNEKCCSKSYGRKKRKFVLVT